MAKRKLPKGIREKNGAYEARAMVNGIKINMYSANLDNLIEDFVPKNKPGEEFII